MDGWAADRKEAGAFFTVTKSTPKVPAGLRATEWMEARTVGDGGGEVASVTSHEDSSAHWHTERFWASSNLWSAA